MSDALLIFLDARNDYEGWLHLRGREIVARGTALEGLPPPVDPETAKPLGIVAVVPGDAAVVHWLEVPAGLAPAQAIAAARLMALEASAQPLADMHVAIGPEVEEGQLRAVALVPALAMAGWLGRMQADGLDPDLILPEPLLLPPPDDGFIRYDRGEIPLYRGPNDAFSIEPELADLIVAGAAVETIDTDVFEAGLFEAVARPPVNLRQGDFAKRRRWKIEWKVVRRLAMLLVAILFVTFAIQIVSILRYTYAADALETEAQEVAGTVLPGTTVQSDASASLARRLADLRGGGVGYGPLAASVFAAVQATVNAELTGIAYDRDGSMRITVQADGPATFTALEQRIEADGFAVDVGPTRSGGGRPTAEMTVSAS